MLSNWKHSPCVRSGLHCHEPWSKARWSGCIPGTACQPEHRHCSLSQLLSGHLSGARRVVSGQRWQSAGFRAFPARLRVHGTDGARGLARSPADFRFEGIFPVSQIVLPSFPFARHNHVPLRVACFSPSPLVGCAPVPGLGRLLRACAGIAPNREAKAVWHVPRCLSHPDTLRGFRICSAAPSVFVAVAIVNNKNSRRRQNRKQQS